MRWANTQLNNIRPAKYPHQTKLVRLWGHVANLWPLSNDELQPYSNDEIVALPDYNLPGDAPNVFVSFNSFDRALAIEIRKRFVEWGWQTWLYINQIPKGKIILDEVKSAVLDCRAAMVLITPTSIGSAWVYTEFETLTGLGKPVIAIFDTTKKELTDVLETWKKGEHYSNTYSKEMAGELVRLYRENKGDHHIEGYETTMNAFLSQLSFFDRFAMYPERPANWSAPADFMDFSMLKNNLQF
jgi:hypothetical protein